MRLVILLSALTVFGLAGPASPLAQIQPAPTRPQVAVVVVTLDEVRQIQTKHGRGALDLLGDPRWGRFDWVEPPLTPEAFASCENDRADRRLDYCIRFYLTRAELPVDGPPTVVVVLDDYAPRRADSRGGEMRVTCYGRGVVPADPVAQDTWLWPTSARMHGSRDWDRDVDAMARCIAAAASETWTGLRQPDVS